MIDTLRLTAEEALAMLERREVSSSELHAAYCVAAGERDGELHAYLRLVDGDVDGSEGTGVPIALKDVISTKGVETTAGSKILAGYVPVFDSTVAARCKAAGMPLIGKTNTDEFAMGSSTENSAYGASRNPWDPTRVPGGSGGGTAAAISAGLAPWGLGSDTGGSVKQPSALCGNVGLRPTYGTVSRFGIVAFASSLDQIGPLARSAADCALVMESIAGHDPGDSTSLAAEVPAYTKLLDEPLTGLRIGRVAAHYGAGLDPEVAAGVEAAFAAFEAAGATIHEVELPHAEYGIPTYYLIAPCEASSNLARYDGVHYGHRAEPERGHRAEPERGHRAEPGEPAAAYVGEFDSPLVEMYCRSRAEGFGPEVKRRIMLGTYALSAGYYDAFYAKALRVRRLIQQDFLKAFETVDLIAGPVSPTPAFKLGEKTGDPLAMYLVDMYTVGTNLAGIGGISFPCGFTAGGLPIGFQLQGPALAEPLLLRAAHQYQQQTDWHLRRPALAT
ncbi:MAG: amidase family protein [Planctomycetota bacterium]|nr:amidase family protein [Planctomycetota bacterium]